jgi:hypothetical protein
VRVCKDGGLTQLQHISGLLLLHTGRCCCGSSRSRVLASHRCMGQVVQSISAVWQPNESGQAHILLFLAKGCVLWLHELMCLLLCCAVAAATTEPSGAWGTHCESVLCLQTLNAHRTPLIT